MTINALPNSVTGKEAIYAARWAATAAEIAEYKATHGKLPGDNSVSSRERALRAWMHRQRQKEAAGKLTPEQSAALDRVDAGWRSNQVHLAWWNRMAEAKKAYDADPGDTEACRWISAQQPRFAQDKLRADQIEALDNAFPLWRGALHTRWEQQAGNLQAYVAEHETFPTSRSKDPEAYKLSLWLREQRRMQNIGSLKAERTAKLDQLVPGWRRT